MTSYKVGEDFHEIIERFIPHMKKLHREEIQTFPNICFKGWYLKMNMFSLFYDEILIVVVSNNVPICYPVCPLPAMSASSWSWDQTVSTQPRQNLSVCRPSMGLPASTSSSTSRTFTTTDFRSVRTSRCKILKYFILDSQFTFQSHHW